MVWQNKDVTDRCQSNETAANLTRLYGICKNFAKSKDGKFNYRVNCVIRFLHSQSRNFRLGICKSSSAAENEAMRGRESRGKRSGLRSHDHHMTVESFVQSVFLRVASQGSKAKIVQQKNSV